jgi:D-lyxose ketol-isomerase
MKRSEINELVRTATACFREHHWSLPPKPRWDVSDFGLGDWQRHGLVLVNLTSEAEYCEKLMYAKAGMTTPCHCHHLKKEDIICRCGELSVRAWPALPRECEGRVFPLLVNGEIRQGVAGEPIRLRAGERVTLPPHVYHEFVAVSPECIMGEVSTANDDRSDNFFLDPSVGRFPQVIEDEPPAVRLVSDPD